LTEQITYVTELIISISVIVTSVSPEKRGLKITITAANVFKLRTDIGVTSASLNPFDELLGLTRYAISILSYTSETADIAQFICKQTSGVPQLASQLRHLILGGFECCWQNQHSSEQQCNGFKFIGASAYHGITPADGVYQYSAASLPIQAER
jgi:hypothetical protein